MEAVPKSDIKSVIKSDIRFDISIKRTTWIGHKVPIMTLVPLWTNFNANGSVRWHTSLYLNLFHWPMGENSGNGNGVCRYVRANSGQTLDKI